MTTDLQDDLRRVLAERASRVVVPAGSRARLDRALALDRRRRVRVRGAVVAVVALGLVSGGVVLAHRAGEPGTGLVVADGPSSAGITQPVHLLPPGAWRPVGGSTGDVLGRQGIPWSQVWTDPDGAVQVRADVWPRSAAGPVTTVPDDPVTRVFDEAHLVVQLSGASLDAAALEAVADQLVPAGDADRPLALGPEHLDVDGGLDLQFAGEPDAAIGTDGWSYAYEDGARHLNVTVVPVRDAGALHVLPLEGRRAAVDVRGTRGVLVTSERTSALAWMEGGSAVVVTVDGAAGLELVRLAEMLLNVDRATWAARSPLPSERAPVTSTGGVVASDETVLAGRAADGTAYRLVRNPNDRACIELHRITPSGSSGAGTCPAPLAGPVDVTVVESSAPGPVLLAGRAEAGAVAVDVATSDGVHRVPAVRVDDESWYVAEIGRRDAVEEVVAIGADGRSLGRADRRTLLAFTPQTDWTALADAVRRPIGEPVDLGDGTAVQPAVATVPLLFADGEATCVVIGPASDLGACRMPESGGAAVQQVDVRGTPVVLAVVPGEHEQVRVVDESGRVVAEAAVEPVDDMGVVVLALDGVPPSAALRLQVLGPDGVAEEVPLGTSESAAMAGRGR